MQASSATPVVGGQSLFLAVGSSFESKDKQICLIPVGWEGQKTAFKPPLAAYKPIGEEQEGEQ